MPKTERNKLHEVKVRLRLCEGTALYSTEPVNSPEKAAGLIAGLLSKLDREVCCVINLDAKLCPINFNIVSMGAVSECQVSMQNVFKTAILSNAAGIMMAHNHPSGSLMPSREDIKITTELVKAGRILNIPVIDHIIIAGGTGCRYSFHEEQPELFTVSEEASVYNLSVVGELHHKQMKPAVRSSDGQAAPEPDRTKQKRISRDAVI